MYQIPEIQSNVYQLSAEDIGCMIRVVCSPIESPEECGASGKAHGEFGPIELDPSAKQTLEQVLGTGGSQFPVSLLIQNKDDAEEIDGKLFVSSNVIKICFQDMRTYGKQKLGEEVLSLKYTIDYPRVELHPFDTRKFKVFYADHKVDAKYDFNKCIELRALSRQSRDLVALLIKCFSAQTYFVNSKVIASASNGSFIQGTAPTFTVSDVLMELEFVKRELYNSINLAKALDKEKKSLCSQITNLEEEMSCTIDSYKAILAANSNETEQSIGSTKNEFSAMQRQLDSYEHERQKHLTEKVLWSDEKANLIKQIDQARQVESYLREQLDECSDKMGIPRSQAESLKTQIRTLEHERDDLNVRLGKATAKLANQTEGLRLSAAELAQTKEYLH